MQRVWQNSKRLANRSVNEVLAFLMRNLVLSLMFCLVATRLFFRAETGTLSPIIGSGIDVPTVCAAQR